MLYPFAVAWSASLLCLFIAWTRLNNHSEWWKELPDDSPLSYWIRSMNWGLPIILIMLAGLVIVTWESAPIFRLAHALWVLGFWLAGTLALWMLRASYRTLPPYRNWAMPAAAIALSCAIWLTPLYRFVALFKTTHVFLLLAIALIGLAVAWFILCQAHHRLASKHRMLDATNGN